MRKTVLLGVLFCLSFISFGCQERSQQEIDRDYFEEVKKKAEKGDAEAQYFLAIMYEFGHSREPNAPEALVWYIKAAENGNTEAMVSLATAYYSGSFDGINDFEKARYWYRKAADAGSDLGQFYLGVVYEKEGDVENAEKWIKLAAANGNKTAQKHIIIKKEKQEVND